MEKPELIKRGIYKKVALCTSPNAKKSKLQNVHDKIVKLKEIKSSEKIFNGDSLKPSLRKSMLIRAVQSTEKEIKQKEKHIISSTPHHTKNQQNGQPFFGRDFSVLLSPIILGRLSDTQKAEEKNPIKSDSSSELMSPKEKNKSKIASTARRGLSVKERDGDSDCNKLQTSVRRSKRDQSTNRSKVTNDVATEKPTDKSPEILPKKSPLKMSSAQHGDIPKSRIPLRLPSHEKNEVQKPRKRILSRSMTETPKKHDPSTNNQDVRDEDENKKPGDKETRRSVSLSPKHVRNHLTFERETEVDLNALSNVSKDLRTSKRPKAKTDKNEENKTITQSNSIVTRSGSRRVQQESDRTLKTSYIHNQQDNVRKYRGQSHSQENEFVNITPRKKNNDTLVLQGLPDPDSDKNASVIIVEDGPSPCEKTNLGNKSRPSALRCQPVNGRSSVFVKSIGLSPIIIQTERRDTTILHNTEKEKSVQFHHNSPFTKSNVNTSNPDNNLDKPTETCALTITDNLSHKILAEKRTDRTELNRNNRVHEENLPRQETGDERNREDNSAVNKRILAKTNDVAKVTEDVISETDAKSKEPDTSEKSEGSGTEYVIKNHKSKNNNAVETCNSAEVREDNNGRNKDVEGNKLNCAGQTDVNKNVQEGNKNKHKNFSLDDGNLEAIVHTEINDNNHNKKENEVANDKCNPRAEKESTSESVNVPNKVDKGIGPLNAAVKKDVETNTETKSNRSEENKATDEEQNAMSVLCSEISAKRRTTSESIDKINIRSDNKDSGKRENRKSGRIRRTVNRQIQTSVGFTRGKTRQLSSRFIEQTTQTSQNSRVTDSSESYPLLSFCTDQSSNGAGSDIILRTLNGPRRRQISHNIFESLQEGPEIDEWSESDYSDIYHHSLSTQPWRFVNDNLVPEQSSSVNLNFIRSENELRLRDSANNDLAYMSDNSNGLSVDNMVSEYCRAPTTKSSRNTTAAYNFDLDTMLSRTERRQYKKKNGKEVLSPKKILSDNTIVSKASKDSRNTSSSCAQRSSGNTPKTQTKYNNRYRKSKSSQRTSPSSKEENIKPTERYIPQLTNAENTSKPLGRNRNRVFSSDRNVVSLSPADQQLLGVRPILASESEPNNSDSSHRPTKEDRGRFSRGKKLYLNKNKNLANSVKNSNLNEEEELETNSIESGHPNTEEDRGRFTRGKQLHLNKNQNRVNTVENSNIKDVQQDNEVSKTDSLVSRNLNTEEDRDRFSRGKQLYLNTNQNRANTVDNSNVKDIQQDDEESETDRLESRNIDTEEDRGRFTKGKQSYSNKNQGRANSVKNSNVNNVQQSEKESEATSLESKNLETEEDRCRFTRSKRSYSNKNQNPAKSVENAHENDGEQNGTESEINNLESSHLNTEDDRGGLIKGKQSFSNKNKNKNRVNTGKNSNKTDEQQNDKEPNLNSNIADIASSNSDNIDKESNHLPGTSAPSNTVKSAGRSKRTKKQKEKAGPSVQLDESNNNQTIGERRSQRTRKPPRFLTDLKLNDYQLVKKGKEKTKGKSAKSSDSNNTVKENVEVKEKPKKKVRTKKQKIIQAKEADIPNENLDVISENERIQIHELPGPSQETDAGVPSLHNSVDDNQPPIELPVTNEFAMSPSRATLSNSLGTLRVLKNLTNDSGVETINGIISKTFKRSTLSKTRIGGKKRHIETELNKNDNKEPATESRRSGESSKRLSVKGKSNKQDKNRKTMARQETDDTPNDYLANNDTENDFNKISEIPVTSQAHEDAIPSPRSSSDENRPSTESRVGQPVTEIECMPPPNGCSTINSFGARRVRRQLSGDSGFETISGIDKTTKRKYSTRIRTTAKKRQVEAKQRDGCDDVSGANQADDDVVPESAHFVPAEHNTDSSLFQFPNNTIQGGISKTHKKQNVAKDVTNRVSRALERASESFRTLDQTAFSQRSNETRNNGSRRFTEFSELVADDYLNYNLSGQLYRIKYANQLPSDGEYRRIGDIEMTQTLKFPKNDITAGYIRIQPGGRKKAAYAKNYSFVYTLIKGSAIIQVENRTSTLQAGSFFCVPVGSQYSIRNTDLQSQLILSYLRTATV